MCLSELPTLIDWLHWHGVCRYVGLRSTVVAPDREETIPLGVALPLGLAPPLGHTKSRLCGGVTDIVGLSVEPSLYLVSKSFKPVTITEVGKYENSEFVVILISLGHSYV